MAQAGERIAAAGSRVVDEIEQREARQEYFAARRALNDWDLREVHDPVNGAVTLRGKDAFGVEGRLAKSYDEEVERLSKGLKTRDGQRAFAEAAIGRRQQLLEWASGHVAQQRKAYEEGEFKANMKSISDRASRLASLPLAASEEQRQADAIDVAQELSLGKSEIARYMKGSAPEAVSAAIRGFMSNIHHDAVTAITVAGDSERASAYLEKHKAEIDGDTVTKLKGPIRELVARKKAAVFADKLEPRIEGGKLSYGAAMDEIKAAFDAGTPERELAMARVKEVYANWVTDKKAAADTAFQTAMNIVIAPGGSRSKIDPDVWDKLDVAHKEHIIKWEEARTDRARREAERPDKIKTDYSKFQEAIDMATKQELQAEFLRRGLAYWQPFLDKGDMNTVERLYIMINKDQAKAAEVAALTDEALRSVKSALDAAGIKHKPGTEGAKRYDALATQVRVAVADLLLRNLAEGKLVPRKDELQKIVLRLLATRVESGALFGGERRVFEIRAAGEDESKYVSKKFGAIPPLERDALIRDLLPDVEALGDGVYRNKNTRVLIGDKEKRVIERAYTEQQDGGDVKAGVEFSSIPPDIRALIVRDQFGDKRSLSDDEKRRAVKLYEGRTRAGWKTLDDWKRNLAQ